MNAMMQMVLIYLGVLLLMMLLVNILTKGFLFKYLNARTGKRKGKVLLMVDAKYFSYLTTGLLIEGWLTYKDRDKHTRRISLSKDFAKNCAEDFLGVVWVKVDEEKNCILKRDYSAVSGYDATHCEELYQRALNRSKLNDYKKQLQMILIICGIGALFSLVGVVLLVQMKKAILIQLQYCDLRTLATMANQTMQTAGNVVVGGNMV